MNRRRVIGVSLAGLAFVGTLVVVTAFELNRPEGADVQEESLPTKQVMAEAARYGIVPGRIGPLDLVRRAEGPEAIDRFSRLLGRRINLIDAVYAEFSEEASQCRLWIGWVADASAAARIVSDVQTEITAGDTPYTKVSESRFDSLRVLEFEGLSQNHALFASSGAVFWVSADSKIYKTTLLYLLDRFTR